MTDRKYLEPAASIIRAFGGPDGDLTKGIDAVASITKKDRTRVFRWMRPKDVGGTGGRIPGQQRDVLYEAARRRRLPITAEDFFGGARAA